MLPRGTAAVAVAVAACGCLGARCALAAPQTPRGGTAAATSDLRALAIGEVRDAKGEPWCGVEVVLIARPLPNDAEAGDADRVVATTDDRGRFRAVVLRGRPYSVWAWGTPTAAGRPASAVAERVFAQEPVVLRETRSLPARELVLDHVERWSDHRLRVRVVDGTEQRDVHWLDVDAATGRVRLPFLVGAGAWLDLFVHHDGFDRPLRHLAIADDRPPERRIELPEPEHVTVHAQAADGSALAGATVYRRLGHGDLFPIGITDAAGTLALTVPANESLDHAVLFGAAGHTLGACQHVERLRRHGGRRGVPDAPAAARPRDLFGRLDHADTVTVRVVGLHARPLANVEVWQSHGATNAMATNTSMRLPWTRSLRTDASGTVELPAGKQLRRVDAHVLLRESDLAALPERWRSRLHPVVFAPLGTATGTGTRDDPFVVNLAQSCPIDLEVIADGVPCAHADVVLATLRPDTIAEWPRRAAAGACTDGRGRLRLLVPAGDPFGIAVTSGMRMDVRAVTATRGSADADPATMRIALGPPTGIRGRVLLANGEPASGCRVATALVDPASAQWPAPVGRPPIARGGGALFVDPPRDAVTAMHLAHLVARAVVTDAHGRFALPLPPMEIRGLRLFASGPRVPGESRALEREWTGEPMHDVEWRLAR